MEVITVDEFKQCGASHTGLDGHIAGITNSSDNSIPPSINKMTKTEQNTLCGKCHYSKEIFGDMAINPHAKHGPLMSVGFD